MLSASWNFFFSCSVGKDFKGETWAPVGEKYRSSRALKFISTIIFPWDNEIVSLSTSSSSISLEDINWVDEEELEGKEEEVVVVEVEVVVVVGKWGNREENGELVVVEYIKEEGEGEGCIVVNLLL